MKRVREVIVLSDADNLNAGPTLANEATIQQTVRTLFLLGLGYLIFDALTG